MNAKHFDEEERSNCRYTAVGEHAQENISLLHQYRAYGRYTLFLVGSW